VTGFLVPAGDSRAMAERIERLADHPELKEELGGKALAQIQRYGLRGQVERLVEVYRDVQTSRQGPHLPAFETLLYDASEPWNMPIRAMFQRLAEVEQELQKRLMICRADLSDDTTWGLAKLLLIPSRTEYSGTYAVRALQRRIPIIAPEEADDLKGLCLISNAGLCFRSFEEFRDYLLLLLSNEPLRQALGSNGQQYIASELTPTVVSNKTPL
jgi:glycosyltransferase involved in cell wall biosynthesis